MLLGSVLGIIFGASSLYLFLKVSMTVSASIPVAVLSITIFRGLSRAFGIRRATILENNVVQTAGSAGESIAFGVGAAMPALMLLGYELELTRVMLVAVLGGLLGILMMIPLTAGVHRQAARRAPLPRRNSLRQGPDRRRTGWVKCQDRIPGRRIRIYLSAPDASAQVLVRALEDGRKRHHRIQQGGRFPRAIADATGRRVHHRAPNRLGDGRRRHHDGAV